MEASIDNDSPANEVAPYLSEHLNDLGIERWLVTVARDSDSATQGPNGEPEISYGDTDSPGYEAVFEVRDVSVEHAS